MESAVGDVRHARRYGLYHQVATALEGASRDSGEFRGQMGEPEPDARIERVLVDYLQFCRQAGRRERIATSECVFANRLGRVRERTELLVECARAEGVVAYASQGRW